VDVVSAAAAAAAAATAADDDGCVCALNCHLSAVVCCPSVSVLLLDSQKRHGTCCRCGRKQRNNI